MNDYITFNRSFQYQIQLNDIPSHPPFLPVSLQQQLDNCYLYFIQMQQQSHPTWILTDPVMNLTEQPGSNLVQFNVSVKLVAPLATKEQWAREFILATLPGANIIPVQLSVMQEKLSDKHDNNIPIENWAVTSMDWNANLIVNIDESRNHVREAVQSNLSRFIANGRRPGSILICSSCVADNYGITILSEL